MKVIPYNLIREKNKLFTAGENAWLILLDIDLGGGTVFYLCSNTEDVTFLNRTYTAFPFYLDPARQNSKGEIPTLSLKVCNVTQLIHVYLEDLDGAVGATVTVRVVNAGYLDEDFSELEMDFSILATEADAEWITFPLGAASPLRRRFPPNRFIALHCNWEFKSVECAYAGAETTCDRTWKRCEELNQTSRSGGYPGLNLKGWRLV
jgi:lambda family phage minor tail protein L